VITRARFAIAVALVGMGVALWWVCFQSAIIPLAHDAARVSNADYGAPITLHSPSIPPGDDEASRNLVASKSSVAGRVLDDKGNPASGALVSWRVLSVSGATQASDAEKIPAWSGSAIADDNGSFLIQSRGGFLLSVHARSKEGDSWTCRGASVSVPSQVNLHLLKARAAFIKLIDSSDGQHVVAGDGELVLAINNAALGRPNPTWDGDIVLGIADRLGASDPEDVLSSMSQGGLLIAPDGQGQEVLQCDVRAALIGFLPLQFRVPMRMLNQAILEPTTVVLEPSAEHECVVISWRSASGGHVAGRRFVAVRRSSESKVVDAGESRTVCLLRAVDVSKPTKIRLKPGDYECATTVVSSIPLVWRQFSIARSSGLVSIEVSLPPSGSLDVSGVDAGGNPLPSLVIKRLRGLESSNRLIDLESVWPTRPPWNVLVRDLPLGRYRLSWRAGFRNLEEDILILADQVSRSVVTID
jgi:hypothetical protein